MAIKWTVEALRAEALKYKTRKDFRRGSPSAVVVAGRLGILDEICAHMSYLNTRWTVPMIQAEADKYTTRNDFAKGCFKAYDAASRRGILDEVCAHMVDGHDWWTVDEIIQLAANFTRKVDFKRAHEAAYNAANRLGITEQAFAHMPSAAGGFDRAKPGILYYLRLNAPWLPHPVYKVGITNLTTQKRYQNEATSFTVIAEINFSRGIDALMKERDIIQKHRAHLYTGEQLFKNTKNTELFTCDVLSLDQAIAA